MIVYPTNRGRLLNGNLVSASALNEEIRETSETARSLDSSNFAEETIDYTMVKDSTFNSMIVDSGYTPGSFIISTDYSSKSNITMRSYQNTNNYPRGLMKGRVQINWTRPPCLREGRNEIFGGKADTDNDPAWYGLTTAYTMLSSSVKFTVYINGVIAGETDNICEGTQGSTSIPTFYYHDGGPIRIDYVVSLPIGMEFKSEYESGGDYDMGTPFKFRADNLYSHFTIRVR